MSVGKKEDRARDEDYEKPNDITPDPMENESEEEEEEEQVATEAVKKSQRRKEAIAKFIDHWIFVTWMTLLTVYALFFDDLRLIFFTSEVDDYFFSVSCLALFFFAFEIVLASYAKYEEYWMSFFFWLDVVSTLSLIPDIGWIMDAITG
jgi:uncharacterized membrane protein